MWNISIAYKNKDGAPYHWLVCCEWQDPRVMEEGPERDAAFDASLDCDCDEDDIDNCDHYDWTNFDVDDEGTAIPKSPCHTFEIYVDISGGREGDYFWEYLHDSISALSTDYVQSDNLGSFYNSQLAQVIDLMDSLPVPAYDNEEPDEQANHEYGRDAVDHLSQRIDADGIAGIADDWSQTLDDIQQAEDNLAPAYEE